MLQAIQRRALDAAELQAISTRATTFATLTGDREIAAALELAEEDRKALLGHIAANDTPQSFGDYLTAMKNLGSLPPDHRVQVLNTFQSMFGELGRLRRAIMGAMGDSKLSDPADHVRWMKTFLEPFFRRQINPTQEHPLNPRRRNRDIV